MARPRTTCTIVDCGRTHKAKGYCRMHYWRYVNNGDPHKTKSFPPHIPLEDRVRAIGWLVADSGCWEWRGYRDTFGYPMIMFANKAVRVHRYIFEQNSGESIAPGNVIMHSCDNPPCVNPNHLSQGTQAENILDMVAKGRHKKGMGRLSEQDVRDIRRRVRSGDAQRAIERDYGLSGGSVSRIMSGKNYSWVK